MKANEMALAIQNSGIKNSKDASTALQFFWNAICNYISNNCEVKYAWIGTNPGTGIPDPIVFVNCKVNATGSLTPCNLKDTNAALGAMSTQMNTNAATWTVIPDIKTSPGFLLTPSFIIPSIVLTPSNLNNNISALEHICNQIILGIKTATPVMTGTHLTFVGTATFLSII